MKPEPPSCVDPGPRRGGRSTVRPAENASPKLQPGLVRGRLDGDARRSRSLLVDVRQRVRHAGRIPSGIWKAGGLEAIVEVAW